jgi:AcrR family transcriptional regulator
MARTGGDITKQKILDTAERLFSQNGFNATSVSKIAKEANVNKALIYYYFKDKNDLVLSLFRKIIEELSDSAIKNKPAASKAQNDDNGCDNLAALRSEISYLNKKKNIIAILLMESLKSDDDSTFLFECAEIVTAYEHPELNSKPQIVKEFFTGFIPLISFLALQDKFCNYFEVDKNNAMEYFIDSFTSSHMTVK